MKKIRIMYVMGGIMDKAGAPTVAMRYLRQLAKNDSFEFSVLVHGDGRGYYDEEIENLGIPIYHAPIRGEHPLRYSSEVRKILRNHPVDMVHCHMDSSCGYFLEIAKKQHIKGRIAHSHTTNYQAKHGIKRLIGFVSKKKIHTVATLRLACSEAAGRWLYGKDSFHIMNNAIDLRQYSPKEGIRKKVRDDLRISPDVVLIGNFGRLCYEKNQSFLLDVLKECKKNGMKAKLMIAGTGELSQKLEEYAATLQVRDDVFFLGQRNDIPDLLQAIDCFAMPSFFEGLPVAGIEAQAAGIPCLFSDRITPEICMTAGARLLPIDHPQKWADAILHISKDRNAGDAQRELRKNGYDIVEESERLAKLYVSSC